MTVELRPLGVACNIGCRYCYQQPQRDARERKRPYDLEAMKAAADRRSGPITLFGGEPLLVPIEDLEELWRYGHERHGGSFIQTNGTLIEDEHVRLFRRYNVHVGISIDGPGELNDVRWSRTLERTRAATARAQAAIARLAREWRPPALIVTLHRGNATAAELPRMGEWMRELDALGVSSVRLHLLEVDAPEVRRDLALDERENVAAVLFFARLQAELSRVRFDVIDDLRALLMGRDGGTACVWRGCDPYTTEAVQGVEGDGRASNCGRTNKDGVDFVEADAPGYERYLMLYQTPQEAGGCKGCRFFLMCKGQCPGTAIDGDWRNRTEHCETWKRLFELLESALEAAGERPLSRDPLRRPVELRLFQRWAHGGNPRLEEVVAAERAEARAR
jgi:uncharacterized protein